MHVHDPHAAWLAALHARHTAELTLPEIRRALQALSTTYGARRDRLSQGRVFGGSGKRAAFALYYTAVHFLTVRAVLAALPAAAPRRVVDVGCGCGAAGAAWALHGEPAASIVGLDVNAWALAEARWNWARLGLRGQARRADATTLRPSEADEATILAYTVNELQEGPRQQVLSMLQRARGPVLVLEPWARGVTPWWPTWEAAFLARGGRADEWKLPVSWPPWLEQLGRAARLHPTYVGGRTLWLGA